MFFVMDSLKAPLNITSMEVPPFTILGVDCALSRLPNTKWFLRLSQQRYALAIVRLVVTRLRSKDLDALATEEEVELFRIAVGCLTWLAGNTRPDLSYYASTLASRISKLSVRYLKVADKAVLQAHKHSDVELKLYFLGQKHPLIPTLVAFGDSSLAGECESENDDSEPEDDTATQQGLIICACREISKIEDLGKGFLQLNFLFYRSCKCPRSVVSTFGAEIIALHETVDRGIGIAQNYDDMLGWSPLPKIPPVPLLFALTDGDSGVSHLIGNRITGEERRLRGFASSLRCSLRYRELQELAHLPGAIQLADDLTKPTGSPQILDALTQGGVTLSHEKAWLRIRRASGLPSRHFEVEFARRSLDGTPRGAFLLEKLALAPLPPVQRSPGKPGVKSKAKL